MNDGDAVEFRIVVRMHIQWLNVCPTIVLRCLIILNPLLDFPVSSQVIPMVESFPDKGR